jgi:O-antigen/teichoic acid export membrane protein
MALSATEPTVSLPTTIAANYTGAAVSAVAPLLALPCYLALLGPDRFGLVAFMTALQGTLNILDAGLSQALVREVAVRRGRGITGVPNELADLVLGCERLYWGVAAVVAAALLLASGPLVAHWLQAGPELDHMARIVVCGGVALFFFQFPGSLYRSVLVGTDRQVQLSASTTVNMVARHLGGVLLLTVSPSILTYVLWQVAVACAETVTRAVLAWRAVGGTRRLAQWNRALLSTVLPAFAGLGLASVIGALTAQLDRLFLSGMVTIDAFGRYAIASTVAMGALQLVYPAMQALTLRTISAHSSPAQVRRLYCGAGLWLGLLALVCATLYLVAGHWLLEQWLQNPQVAGEVYPILALLLVGTALNAAYGVGYLRWLAQARIRTILSVNLLAAAVCVLAIPLMIQRFGPIGATSGWIAANAIALLLCLIDLRRKERA